ncbi:hypothetical protein FACS1894181_18740 [Bacteroidia bacterium]|nr:hypothetical protein FACS1894181_18740 [Bacteroidia bacterium]
MDANILGIYYMADEFSKKFDGVMEGHRLAKKTANRTGTANLSCPTVKLRPSL